MVKAALTNASRPSTAPELAQDRRRHAEDLDDAEAALRTAQARLNSAQTRLARRSGQPGQRLGPAGLFPAGRNRAGRASGGVAAAARQYEDAVFRAGAVLPHQIRRGRQRPCDGCEAEVTAQGDLHRASAEYTPPVIYSLDERAKLVFLIEARPATRTNCASASR